MATHKSAEKRNRQTITRTATNRSRVSRVRTFVRKVEEAIDSGDSRAAAEALKIAQPELMRAAGKGAIKKETASRRVSRLAARVKGLSASASPATTTAATSGTKAKAASKPR